MTFLAPGTRWEVLRRMSAHLRERGRLVVGFGAGRGYEFAEFLTDADQCGLTSDLLLSTWDLRPFTDRSDFLVALLRSRSAAPSASTRTGSRSPRPGQCRSR